MAKNIRGIGRMENRMAKGKIIILGIMFGQKDFGKMEKNKELKKMKNIIQIM